MKKTILGITILLLAVLGGCGKDTSAAQSSYGNTLISETMEVPEHYAFESVSESGKSKVLVDADIIVPEVYGADIIEAIPTVFSEEQINTFIKQHTGDFEWYNTKTNTVYSGEGFSKEDLGETFNGAQSYSLYLENTEEVEKGGAYREILVSFWVYEETGEIAYTPTLEYANSERNPGISQILPLNNENMANDCTISLDEAINFADAEAHLLSSDFALSQYGQLDQKMGEGHVSSPQYYGLKYTRKINGIPVNPDLFRGVGGDDGPDYTAGTECVWITVNDDGVCWIHYVNPTQVGEVVTENVELLPFQDIIDIFEKVSMLSIKHLEMYDHLVENVMDIRKIRFGYMAVKQSESIGGYRYIPVWDFYGVHYPVYEDSQFYPESCDDPVFTINAVDGTVIDRNMGY